MAKKKAKKRRKPYDGDPMMVTTLPRWGTKAQGKQNERERAYKNRIHELETALAGAQGVIEHTAKSRDGLMRMLDTVLSPRYVAALRKVCLMPLLSSVELGVDEPIGILCVWLAQLENPDVRGSVAGAIVGSMDKGNTQS